MTEAQFRKRWYSNSAWIVVHRHEKGTDIYAFESEESTYRIVGQIILNNIPDEANRAVVQAITKAVKSGLLEEALRIWRNEHYAAGGYQMLVIQHTRISP